MPIGRYPRTLTLEERGDGLHWSVTPPESRQDVREAIERGDLRAGSWQMVVAKDRWAGDVRHVEQISELRDVSVVSAAAYPSASVEYRSAPNKKETSMSTDNTSEVPAEEASAEDNTEATEERSALPNHAGSLRVEDRVDPAFGNTSLAQAFESRGFPNETASVGWDEFRSLTFGGTIDVLNQLHTDGVALGYDQRYAFPAFPSQAVGAGVTSVQVFAQDSRVLPAGSVVTRPIAGTAVKPEVSTSGSVTTVPLSQVAAIESDVPNIFLEQSSFESLVEVDLRLAINSGLDDLVWSGVQSAGFVAPGTDELLISIRSAMGTVEANGYIPDTLLLPPGDAAALDVLRTNGTVWPNSYVFAPAQLAPRSIFGLSTRTYSAGTCAIVCDSRALGKLYVSPVNLARFEQSAGAVNMSTIRLETTAAFGVERTGAAVRIANS